MLKRYCNNLSNIPGLIIGKEKKRIQSNYTFFTVILNESLFENTWD